jgi:hypothetical protein
MRRPSVPMSQSGVAMMRTGILLALGFAMSLLPAVSFAQQGAAAAPPKAPVEINQLPLVGGGGRFECEGKNFASPLSPEHATRLIVTSNLELDGFWYVVQGAEKKTALNPTPGKFRAAFGFDTASKKFVTLLIDNLGGRAMETAGPVSAGKAVFTGTYTLNGTDYSVRDTYTPTGHVGEVQVSGAWKKTDQETCTKK